jgi:3-oxoacyl-[acyl-carrier protein] reductase
MNKFDFKNRTAVITGGGQGFGLDIAKRFLDSGAKVIIWDIDEELLKSATNEVNNPNLSYNVIDVSNYSQIENTVSRNNIKKQNRYFNQ